MSQATAGFVWQIVSRIGRPVIFGMSFLCILTSTVINSAIDAIPRMNGGLDLSTHTKSRDMFGRMWLLA
jgi:hypothetical protein